MSMKPRCIDPHSCIDAVYAVILKKFSDSKCTEMYPPERLLERGFDQATQMCYGDMNTFKDTCQSEPSEGASTPQRGCCWCTPEHTNKEMLKLSPEQLILIKHLIRIRSLSSGDTNNVNIFEGHTSIGATSELVVTVAHGHAQPQRSHRCVADLLDRNRISDGGGSGAMDGKVDKWRGDSGGPLQILNEHVKCMYTVVGVISFGRACGFVGEPGIYTRVSAYTPWIESIIWPN
ncbi:Transmembrane protease serine 11F [Eumeta japonica]|uniref:Transmembrane protease serine 11F n=1 Tax=Eumeta variegata TaxID=151549 RepID=A0A4C1T6S2_EUMVA|nr:Transmembrane protease serine 11F [Eumeta japonica]